MFKQLKISPDRARTQLTQTSLSPFRKYVEAER
jgi:hypothetical protein